MATIKMMWLHKKVKTNPSSYQNKDSQEFDDQLLVTLKKLKLSSIFFYLFLQRKRTKTVTEIAAAIKEAVTAAMMRTFSVPELSLLA